MRPSIIPRLTGMFIILSVNVGCLSGQVHDGDVAQLKDGSVIEGVMIEHVTKETIKIQMNDRNIPGCDLPDIKRIKKEARPAQTPSEQSDDQYPSLSRTFFLLQAGVAIPLGEFASKTGSAAGTAKVGYTIGAELKVPIGGPGFWLIGGLFSVNAVDVEALRNSLRVPPTVSINVQPWLSIMPFTGIGFIVPISGSSAFQMSIDMGILIGKSPKVSYPFGGSLGVFSNTAGAFGFSWAFVTSSNFSIQVMFHTGEPTYTATTTMFAGGFPYETTASFEQSMSLLQVVAGIGF